MGYIRHHSIVVTSWDDVKFNKIYIKARSIFGSLVSDIIQSNINGYKSFFIAPDGSKEGWEESNTGDIKRNTFIKNIDKFKYCDGSNSIRYCELFYGDDEGKSEIVRHN